MIGYLNRYKEGLTGSQLEPVLSNDDEGAEGRNMPGGIDEKVGSQGA